MQTIGRSVEYANTIVMSQTVITQPCYGAIHETTCHLFIYAASGATRRNWNEKSKSSPHQKRCGNIIPTPQHPSVSQILVHVESNKVFFAFGMK